MKVNGSNACFTVNDLENFKKRGFDVFMHTATYTNGITVSLPGGATIGFHNWIDNADCYVGDEQVYLKNEAHLNAVLALMDSVVALKNFEKNA